MAKVVNGDIVIEDGRIDCHDTSCVREHEYVKEGERYVWMVHLDDPKTEVE